jgi:hypothetical protein
MNDNDLNSNAREPKHFQYYLSKIQCCCLT